MYNLEVFTDQFEYVDFDFIDERQPLDMDYLAYNAYTVTTKMMDAKKGYFVRITRDNVHVASGYIADVQPGKTTQEISIKPLQSLFDVEVFYTPVSDCITWLATNIQAALMNNADTLQNRPITLTYTASADALPLTGFNLHKTVNILSVIISALKTYGVVCTMSLDVTNKRIVVDIAQQTATQIIEANLENVLQSSVTLGDSYGSTNKLIIRKTDKDSGENLGETTFYLHNDGTINTTNTNRIYPVFWELETLDTEDDQTAAQWLEKATARAKEVLEPAKYDNEIVLMYDVDDQIVHPADAQIGTDTTIYLDGLTYASILTGKKIEGQKITLTYGVVRQDLTKKLAIRQRETMTFENTVSAVMANVAENYPSKSKYNTDISALQAKTSRLSSQGTVFTGTNIEFNPPGSAYNGGYIDFHYNGNTADYTSRIIEFGSGQVEINAPAAFRINGNYLAGIGLALHVSSGRYYKITFTTTYNRIPVLIVRNHQSSPSAMAVTVVSLRTDGTAIASDGNVTNPSSGVLQIDNGASSWAVPIIIYPIQYVSLTL